VFEKARRGEPVTVAAIGGSIKPEDARRTIRRTVTLSRWRSGSRRSLQIQGDFCERAVGARLVSRSDASATRHLARNPDLVIVEWAVNNMAGKDFAESYEGVLRQLLEAPGNIAVIELFFMHKDGENAQMWQEILGRHYGVPMVSFRDALFPNSQGAVSGGMICTLTWCIPKTLGICWPASCS